MLRSFLLLIALVSATITVHASEQYFVSFGGGYNQFTGFKANNISSGIDPTTKKSYPATTYTPNKAVKGTYLDVSFGRYLPQKAGFIKAIALALELQYGLPATIKGQYVLPGQFGDAGTYQYKLNHMALLADLKLYLLQASKLGLFVDVALGGATNNVSHFVAQSTKYPSGQGGGQDVFNAQRHLTLAYRLGVGINYQLTKQLNLLSSIDYQDNGKVEAGEYQDLGRANDDISGPKQDLKAIGFNLALKYTF